jgi:hypothetical protein
MTATDPRTTDAYAVPGTYRPETSRTVPPASHRPNRVPQRVDVCPACRAWRAACYCAADVGSLRYFAREMTELHMPTGTDVCGCGSRNCVYRTRLAKITRSPGPGPGWTPT